MIPPLFNDLTTQQGETPAAGGHTFLSSSSSWMTRTYSTCWVPLEGAIQHWLDVGHEATLATALAAAGSALYALSHTAREQQARLYKLAEEVRTDLAAASRIADSRSPQPHQQEDMLWPSD